MASQDVSGKTSRLAQMQMRFQQRQQQEKEQKRLELAESKTEKETDLARSALKTAKTNNIGNGKVRQMFDERRRGAGIDRSNPLKPIASVAAKTTSTAKIIEKPIKSRVQGVRSSETVTVQASTRKTISNKQAPINRSQRSLITPENIGERNNNNAFSASINDIDDLDSETMPQGFLTDGDIINKDSNNNAKKSTLNAKRTTTANSIKLNPVLTKKAPSARTTVTSRPQTPPSAKSNKTIQSQAQTQAAKPQTTSPSMKAAKKVVALKTRTPSAASIPTTPAAEKETPRLSAGEMTSPDNEEINAGPAPEGMVSCKICGRHFNPDRVAKHEVVCEKMSKLKRKVYDATKHRIQGTEVEQYFKRKTPNRRKNSNYVSAASSIHKDVSQKKSSWRSKHEEFIAAIRSAKQVQAHLARGGKLSDLPPPPPSENPDYIQCPHCQRRFNQSAAERHIPKCATMLHNKTKPQNSKRQ